MINTIASPSRLDSARIAPIAVLRITSPDQEPTLVSGSRLDETVYHGGMIADEVAAVASLALGIRLKAGKLSRMFERGKDDARGKPVAFSGFEHPSLLFSERGVIVPGARGVHSLISLQWFGVLVEGEPKNEIAMIRAARLYQDSLWIVESEPALAWLLMVSAVEAAARAWDEGASSPVERLRESKPEMVDLVERSCPEILPWLADELAPLSGATRKFVEFLSIFIPPPPASRPTDNSSIQWDTETLRPLLKKIYNYRSRALHSGIPFPFPMCQPPLSLADSPTPSEKLPALGMSARGGAWRQKDIPMYFHVFEYIARSAIKAWWLSLRNSDA